MRIVALTLVISLCFSSDILSQNFKGTVIDAESKAPLSYVNIGVRGKNMGVISRDDGAFDIDLSKAAPDDTLVFSMIGYESAMFKTAELRTTTRDVRLKPKIYQLKEVVITDKKKKPIKLGRYSPSKTTSGHSNTETFGFGGEWGLRISPGGKKYWIEQAGFHLRFNTVDSIQFRIKIYSVIHDLPGESLLKKDIYVKSYKNDHWILRDLSAENLVLDQDVIVTFEVLQLWYSKTGENQIFFTHGSGYKQGRTYSRLSSQDKWSIDDRPPVTLYLLALEY
jgi:hypothetical protein